MQCPKCGRGAAEGAFICAGCDFILDASFLGDDITDDERDQRAPSKRARKDDRPRVDFGEDAMILGNPDEDEVSEFRSRDAGVSQREVTQARFYIGGAIAHLMQDNAVPELAAGDATSMRLTPFERHILGFVNGKRSIARIAKKAAVEDSEFKTAIAMLADKGFVRLKGFKKPRTQVGSRSGAGLSSMLSSGVASSLGLDPSGPRARRPVEGERTVVASMDHIEALARRAPPSVGSGRVRRIDVTSEGGVDDGATRVAETPLPQDAFGAGAGADAGARDAAADDGGWGQSTNSSSVFAESRLGRAVRSRLPSLVDADPEDVVSVPTPVAPRASVAAAAPVADVDGFDGHDAPTRALPAHPRGDAPTRALISAVGPAARELVEDAGGDADADAFASVPTRVLEQLRDPTGLGDVEEDVRDAADGAAVADEDVAAAEQDADEDADGGFDDEDDDDEGAEDDEADDDADAFHESTTGAVARGISQALTRSLPAGRVDDGADGDDDGMPQTVEIVDAVPRPAVAEVATRPEPPAPTPLVPLPGQGIHAARSAPTVPLPGQGVPVPTSPEPSAPATAPAASAAPPASSTAGAAQLASGGGNVAPAAAASAIVSPAAPGRAPSVYGAPAALPLPGQTFVQAGQPVAAPVPVPGRQPGPPRVSAASKVPFELRKKAERIYEQALKDQAEGRTASAVMNAKLAMNFDPTVPAYKELHDALQKVRGGAAPRGQGASQVPRELVLFEQANDAEGRGDYGRAVKLLQEAIEVNPRAAALHNKIGVVLSIRLKRHEEALTHLRQAIDLEPGSVVYMNNFSKVTGLLESVLEKDPKKRKGNADDKNAGQVAIRKIRPLKF